MRWFEKLRSCCKNLHDQAKLGRPNTMDSEVALQATKGNLVSSSQRVSGELDISQSSVACHLQDLVKASGAAELCLTLPEYCKTFDSPEEKACVKNSTYFFPSSMLESMNKST